MSDFFTKMPQKCYERRKCATVLVTQFDRTSFFKLFFCGEDPHTCSYPNECTFSHIKNPKNGIET